MKASKLANEMEVLFRIIARPDSSFGQKNRAIRKLEKLMSGVKDLDAVTEALDINQFNFNK